MGRLLQGYTKLFYDSFLLTSDAKININDILLSLANLPEVLRSTETRWSSMQRTTTFVDPAPVTLTTQYYSFWIPLVKIKSIQTSDVNNEVVCVRFGINVDANGNPIPLLL